MARLAGCCVQHCIRWHADVKQTTRGRSMERILQAWKGVLDALVDLASTAWEVWHDRK